MWFGTWGTGLFSYSTAQNRFPILQNKHLPDSIMVNCFSETSHSLWVGSTGGLYAINKQTSKIEHLNRSTGLSSNNINKIIPHKDSILWIASNSGLTQLNLKTKEKTIIKHPKDTANLLSKKSITDVFHNSSNGTIWVAIFWNGLVKLTPSIQNGNLDYHFKSYAANPEDSTSLSENRVMKFHRDKEGQLWLATQAGLSKYNPDSDDFSVYVKSLAIMSLLEHNNKLYMATCTNGLVVFDLKTKKIEKYFNRGNGKLPEDWINSIRIEKNGNLWLNTEKGLCLFNPKTENYRLFTADDGLKLTHQSFNQLYIDKDDVLYYGGVGGINKFTSDSLWTDITPPSLRITDLKLSNKTILPNQSDSPLDSLIQDKKHLILNHKQNVISIHYGAMHYINPEYIQFAYKLDGLHTSWQNVGNQHTANFSGLSPGNYTFHLKAKNFDGVWNKKGIQLQITIKPPLYWNFLSISLYISILIFISFGFYFWRVNRLKAQAQTLESQITTRTLQLNEANEELTQSNEELNTTLHLVSQAKVEIEAQKEQVDAAHNSIRDSINYAARIQSAVLPENILHQLNIQHLLLFMPRDIVSGDFYWMKQIGETIVIAAADCTGHGVPGAFMSMLGAAFLNEIVTIQNINQPGEILNQLRTKVKVSLKQNTNSESDKVGMDIALYTINTNTKTLYFSGAYNPLVIVRDKSINTPLISNNDTQIKTTENTTHQLHLVKANTQPIGVYIIEKSFITHTIQLQPNDVIYTFSDGYADQLGGPQGRKFMIRKFKELLLDISHKPLHEQKQILSDTINQWMNIENDQVDDILVIGVKL